MQLHGIKTPRSGPSSSFSEGCNNVTDFGLSEFGRHLRELGNLYGRRGQWLPTCMLGIGLAAGMDQLDRDFAAGFVHGMGQIFIITGKVITVDAHFAGQLLTIRSHKRITGNNQADTAPG
jgi:hypothetical protein